jgi:Capsule polysaccharide biosynthesis protein
MSERSPLVKIQDRYSTWVSNQRLSRINRQLVNNTKPSGEKPTAVFFNASTRLSGFSLNAAFSYLAACGLQVAGYPVIHFVCESGMSRCVLGTNKDDHTQLPPCKACIAQSRRIFSSAPAVWFSPDESGDLNCAIQGLNLEELSELEIPLRGSNYSKQSIPLGQLVMPSLRWVLRRHNLSDDEPTRILLREYILSAWRVAVEFDKLLETVQPEVVVVFNGVLFPEASARWVARQRGVRVVTHEVGFKPYSAFFSHGEATTYSIDVPHDLELSDEQNASLDDYLEKRFKGKFSMAGIRFWPEMRGLDDSFNQRAKRFRQIVPVFTNVIYDTSQVHANTVFSDMFAWLDTTLRMILENHDTLFVIRAHPDEMRPGKRSRESVQGWVAQNRVDLLPNVIFVNSNEYLSSYELIERSKFIIVYNSSIGLEAAVLGKTVVCGGESRYTSHNTAFFPGTPEEYEQIVGEYLKSSEVITPPATFRDNARRFMYYQIFRSSLPFGDYMEPENKPGYVRIRKFDWQELKEENSETMCTLVNGIIHAQPFLMGLD